jgi:amino acid permease
VPPDGERTVACICASVPARRNKCRSHHGCANRRSAGEAAHKLHREVSTIGLLFVCLGSIIGSGWLFGALYASQIAGPAAIISWVLVALIMLVLALVHAELGGLYPVAGGSARYPHFSFGSLAIYFYAMSVRLTPEEVRRHVPTRETRPKRRKSSRCNAAETTPRRTSRRGGRLSSSSQSQAP